MAAALLQIHFQLLGALAVRVGDRTAQDFRAQSVRALLSYLAVEGDRAHEREHLGALLWPEVPPQQAQANLRQALHRLRVALALTAEAHELIISADGAVQLNPAHQIQIDSRSHHTLVRAIRAHQHRSAAGCHHCEGLLREALACYRGEFLAGFTLSGSLPFDDWLLLQRECLHDEHIFVLDTLAEHHERRGEDAEASVLLRRWLILEPWRESAHLRLAAAQWRAGATGAAARQLQRCRAALAAAGASPGPELQAFAQQLAAGAPPPRRLRWPAGGLPFVGRAAELGALAAMLADPQRRLITIVGLGGVGKTRLSLEAARLAAPTFREGAVVVPLAGLGPGDDVAAAVMEAVGLPINPARSATSQLHAALVDQERLLVLDNCEHLPACQELIIGLLEAAPGVSVLATSRVPLLLRSEQIFDLEGLALGDEGEAANPLSYDAGALFAAVARRSAPAFEPHAEAENIAALCRRLEGLPLAIELAAAQVAVTSVDAIARALANSLSALSHNLQDLPPRHRSVRAALRWSWALLDPDDQLLLASLSVFVGGFTHDAALEICEAAPRSLDRLVRHSLVRRSPQSGRYLLHPLVRQFAAEMLDPSAGAPVCARFRRRFLALLTNGEARSHALAEERLNIVAAWHLAVEAADGAALLPAASPFAQLISGNGLAAAAELLGCAASALGDRAGEAVGAILYQQARLLGLSGQYERGVAVAEALIAAARACEQPLGLARGYLQRGAIRLQCCRFAEAWGDLSYAGELAATIPSTDGRLVLAHSLLERATLIDVQQLSPDDRLARQALALFRGLGSQADEAMACMRLGNYHRRAGDYAASLACRREALALACAAGDQSTEVRAGNDLGEDLMHLGCYDEARAILERTVALAQGLGFWRMMCTAMEGLARAHHHLGDQRRAQELIREALEIGQRHQLGLTRGYFLTTLGYACESDGDLMAAREAYAASLDAWEHSHAEARLEPQAGLLRLALAQGNKDIALDLARQALPALTEHGLSDALEPLRVYWSCYCALAAAADPMAEMVLDAAMHLLEKQLARISDQGLRHCFVMNIPAHRAIAASALAEREQPAFLQAGYPAELALG